MRKKRTLKHSVVERFLEKTHRGDSEPSPVLPTELLSPNQLRRFKKMVQTRKEHILDKILMD